MRLQPLFREGERGKGAVIVAQLTPKEQHALRALKTAIRRGDEVSAESIADAASVSRSLVYGLSARMGYPSWKDLVAQLRYENSTVSQTRVTRGRTKKICDEISRHAGSAILVRAIGDAAICEPYLIRRLGAKGYQAVAYDGATMRAFSEREGGLVILINESGFALFQECAEAMREGYETVVITSMADSPVARMANVAIALENNKSTIAEYEPNFFTAAALTMIELVCSKLPALTGGVLG